MALLHMLLLRTCSKGQPSSGASLTHLQVDLARLVPCCGREAKAEPYEFPLLPEGAEPENITALQPVDCSVEQVCF